MGLRRTLSLLLLITCAPAASCRGKEAPQNTPLLFHGDMEGRDLAVFQFAVDGKTNPKPTLVKSPAREGTQAVKFEVVRGPDDTPLRYRCEMVARAKGTRKNYMYQDIGAEYWYGFSTFIPADWVLDNEPEIIAQWHGVPDGGEGWRNPNLGLRVHDRSYVLERHWDSDRITLPAGEKIRRGMYDGEENVSLGSMESDRGRWTDWVLHVRWDYNADGTGFTRLWKNGRKVFDKAGPNCFNDKTGPFFRFGLYKWPWKYPRSKRPSRTERRVLFYDAVRIGGSRASYKLVSPKRAPKGPGK